MNYKWYKVLSLTEFIASERVSRTYDVNLLEYGEKEILITSGETYSMVYEGEMFILDAEGQNPFVQGEVAAYLDADNDVWLGFQVDA